MLPEIISLSLFPGGKNKALTFSYDDGQIHDRRLVEIFNRHELRGTFHLNAGILDRENFLAKAEIRELFENHEVSAHSVTHPFLDRIHPTRAIQELLEDRHQLEELVGYPVRGMSYPFGAYNETIVSLLPQLGIHYSRTTQSTNQFVCPGNFHLWHPTAHHKHDLMLKLESFRNVNSHLRWPALFYVWGHSFEFARENNWDLIENFAKEVAKDSSIWYATNIEICDYLTAVRRLEFSVDGKMVYNPSASEVWFTVKEKPRSVAPGATLHLH